MTTLRVAAVQASYVLMDRAATIDRVAALTAAAAAQAADLVVFPEVFVPGTPIWIDTRPIWDGDEDWFALLAENAVTVPGPASERLAAIALHPDLPARPRSRPRLRRIMGRMGPAGGKSRGAALTRVS